MEPRLTNAMELGLLVASVKALDSSADKGPSSMLLIYWCTSSMSISQVWTEDMFSLSSQAVRVKR